MDKRFNACLNTRDKVAANGRKTLLESLSNTLAAMNRAYNADIRLSVNGNKVVLQFGESAEEKRKRKKAELAEKRLSWLRKWSDAYETNPRAWSEEIRDWDTAPVATKIVLVHYEKDAFSTITSRATCASDDTYQKWIGEAIAYARTQGERIPWFI